jgi:hypothetical protein
MTMDGAMRKSSLEQFNKMAVRFRKISLGISSGLGFIFH